MSTIKREGGARMDFALLESILTRVGMRKILTRARLVKPQIPFLPVGVVEVL